MDEEWVREIKWFCFLFYPYINLDKLYWSTENKISFGRRRWKGENVNKFCCKFYNPLILSKVASHLNGCCWFSYNVAESTKNHKNLTTLLFVTFFIPKLNNNVSGKSTFRITPFRTSEERNKWWWRITKHHHHASWNQNANSEQSIGWLCNFFTNK